MQINIYPLNVILLVCNKKIYFSTGHYNWRPIPIACLQIVGTQALLLYAQYLLLAAIIDLWTRTFEFLNRQWFLQREEFGEMLELIGQAFQLRYSASLELLARSIAHLLIR